MATDWPDLYVSDMWTAAGQRVIHDPAFQPAARDAEAFRRHTKGNCLYRNKGDGTFEETSALEGVEMGRWAWSSGGFDWDLDGVPEILIAAGMVTNPSQQGSEQLFLAAGGGEDSGEAARGGRLRERLERAESAHPRGLQLERARAERLLREAARAPIAMPPA